MIKIKEELLDYHNETMKMITLFENIYTAKLKNIISGNFDKNFSLYLHPMITNRRILQQPYFSNGS